MIWVVALILAFSGQPAWAAIVCLIAIIAEV